MLSNPGSKTKQAQFVAELSDHMENIANLESIGPADAYDIFKNCLLQAIAHAAINPDVYLFTTKGQNWKPNSVWATVKYWMLTTNPNVQRIYRVDPTPGACDLGELLWVRSRDGQVDPGMTGFIFPVEG